MKKIKHIIYILPMIIIFASVAIIYYEHYENTVKIIESEYEAKVNLVEQSIYSETKYTEIISKIAERDIHNIMEENSKAIVNKYDQDSNILEWDFDEIKNQSDNMDIYILDRELNIIASTIPEEVGLNFNSYEDFSVLLKKRLEGNTFESDSINFSILEGELKKYSYMPTPDNKYLIEVSVTIKELYPELEDLNIVYLSRDLKDNYPFVEDIRVYKFNKNKQSSHELDTVDKKLSNYNYLKKDRDKHVKIALETKETQEQVIRDENNIYRLRYIPYTGYYEDSRLTWWRSYVIEIVYNDQIMLEKKSIQKDLFQRSIIIISILYLVFSIIIIYLIQKNQEIAYIDHLTKLPNRKRFEEVMEYKILEANKKKTKIAVLFFDLDKFKKINDEFGHNIGDKVLQELANRINREIHKGDIVSRLGGDEFTGLISGLASKEDIILIGERMSEIFKVPLNIDSKEISIKSSIGISIYPDHGNTTEELILKADDAMYEAKQSKKKYEIYEDNI